jgi:hypothetical protein
MDPDTIELWKSIFALIAAVFTAVVAVLGWIKSRRAADSSRVAADQATTTNDTVEILKRRTDDLLTALLQQESQELRLRRVEAYLAAHETRIARGAIEPINQPGDTP